MRKFCYFVCNILNCSAEESNSIDLRIFRNYTEKNLVRKNYYGNFGEKELQLGKFCSETITNCLGLEIIEI